MLKLVEQRGEAGDVAQVFVVALADGTMVECVEAVQPPVPREEKWVLIVSTLKGCPVRCPICDAGGDYAGKLSAEEIQAQILFLVQRRFPDGRVPVSKFKIQFARMGDPAFNPEVIKVLRRLPELLEAPGLMPCISTIAPAASGEFFRELLQVKRDLYGGGHFQMQFSLHTTCEKARREVLVPVDTWSFSRMATYGESFYAPGDRRICLNFAPAKGMPLEPERLLDYFSPDMFMIKLTPINPSQALLSTGLTGLIEPGARDEAMKVADSFRRCGYRAVLSIGEIDENRIGSNCGLLVRKLMEGQLDEG